MGRLIEGVLVLSIFSRVSVCDLNRYTFKVTEDGKDSFNQEMKQYDFTKLYEITPSTFVFEYTGKGEATTVFKEVKDKFRHIIIACEPVKVYNDTIKPGDKQANGAEYELEVNLVCSNYYGFNVSEVWAMGITGKGVVVGINDVGINTDLGDLQGNINMELSMNVLTNKNNVTPEEFPNYKDKAPYFTDHGNRVSSIVAAIKDNNKCSAGIAHNASIVVLKIFNVTFEYGLFGLQPRHWTSSDTIAKALCHAQDDIDISVNAWTTETMFDTLPLDVQEALKHGVHSGRRGRGTIYLVPTGRVGNELSNNINTITVGSIGQNGTIPPNAIADASVITVGLYTGNNLTAESMVTTSHNNKCVTSFKGVSAATSQIAGIIALGLEANPNLTKRDVEHLLVRASDHRGLQETPNFTMNGAGIYFHKVFGFGVLNALKFVKLTKQHQGIPELLSRSLPLTNSSSHPHHTMWFEFCYSCDVSADPNCLTTVEHAEVTIHFKTKASFLHMELLSPLHTTSVLMHQNISTELSKTKLHESKAWSPMWQAKFVSLHFWDETPFGSWKFKIKGHHHTAKTQVSHISLKLHGSKNLSVSFQSTKECIIGYTTQRMSELKTLSKVQNPETDNKDTVEIHSENESVGIGIYVLIVVVPLLIILTLAFVLKKGSAHGIPPSTSQIPLIR